MSRKSKKHARRRAREGALALLYSADIMEANAAGIVESGSYPDQDVHLSDYAESLVEGVSGHCAEIDARLEASSDNWALDRMPVVDRAILRLAVYEMLYVDDVPVSVAINEAVELAKAYGGEDESSRFVNGVLGRIARAADLGDELDGLAQEEQDGDAPSAAEDAMQEQVAEAGPDKLAGALAGSECVVEA